MRLSRAHNTTQSDAKKKIDRKLNDLMDRSFSGVDIVNRKKTWDGYSMDFSFTVRKKPFINVDLRGRTQVTSKDLIINATLPPIVERLVGENKIRGIINRELDKIFS